MKFKEAVILQDIVDNSIDKEISKSGLKSVICENMGFDFFNLTHTQEQKIADIINGLLNQEYIYKKTLKFEYANLTYFRLSNKIINTVNAINNEKEGARP